MGEESFSDIEVQDSVSAVDDAAIEQTEVKGRAWLTPLLLGLGLGITIAIGGTKLISQRSQPQKTPSTSQVAISVPPAMTVTAMPAQATSISRVLNVTGTVAARNLTPVLPQANGLQVKQVLVNVGDAVQAGEVMAILDNSLLQDQIRQARADVESKQADVLSKQADLVSKQAALVSSQAAVAANQAVVQQREADLAQAKARLLDAQRSFRRNQELFAQGAISRQVLDTGETNLATAREAVRQAEANIRTAKANVDSAKANIGSAQASIRIAEAGINSAQATVKSNNARVEQLKTQLRQTVVRAPVSGIVAEKLARVGDITGVPPQTQVVTVVGGSQKLFSIIQDGQLELQAQVPENQLAQIRVGASVQVKSDRDNSVQLQGKVREIEPIVNQQRREATVKIDLPAKSSLKPGMFASAAITTTTQTGVAVPQKAVQSQANGDTVVFMLSGEDAGNTGVVKVDKVKAQKVELGEILNGDRVEIKNGLQVGDRIVIDGAGYVKDSDTVRVSQ
ncbi:efflux RND transporter periplasmic adaptor subunit [Calothrix sp. UHCC 0171]|uniref:efflux RND transporter periplasmic adaptor subunit n=1 Tax=Calothrix sp. UHCC 0171 TaxID=3110245 RepID=UPI002B20A6C6|nr:efflux RND transporter periplasmic adaptor subunit [Calothrix sp. UHCC 0171]MEA5570021.1 efflux RND transporter periplasmic adaptor subunit [Calothrix sp. UHCC 0171]